MKPIMYKVFENHLMSHCLRFIQYANFKIIIFYMKIVCCTRNLKSKKKLNYKKKKGVLMINTPLKKI